MAAAARVEHTVIESVSLEPDGRGGEQLLARVRPKAEVASRCSRCGRRCPGYDVSERPRRWRGLDLGATPVFLQATTGRVSCPIDRVVVAAVPWARPGSWFTAAFEDTAAWLVCHATLSVVAVLLRVAWRSVSGIVTRVVAARAGQLDRLAGLRRIGIDEISYRKGQRYLLVVTDHDTGRLWAGKNRTALASYSSATVRVARSRVSGSCCMTVSMTSTWAAPIAPSAIARAVAGSRGGKTSPVRERRWASC